MELVKHIYKVTESFPSSEIYGLRSQIRRAAVSVPSNIAEGAARKGAREFKQYLNVAQGSISELDTQIELALVLGFVDKRSYDDLMDTVGRISMMLYGLSKTIR